MIAIKRYHLKPNRQTYHALIHGYGKLQEVSTSIQYYEEMVSNGITADIRIYESLVMACGEAGLLEDVLFFLWKNFGKQNEDYSGDDQLFARSL